MVIGAGDPVILSSGDKRILVMAGADKIGTDIGLIDPSELIGKNPGDFICNHSGRELYIRIPGPVDFFEQVSRTGAPMLPRDIGLIIGMTGMNKHSRVLDAGTGSGVATIFFAGVAGHVTSFEKREEFAESAAKNVALTKLSNITLMTGDMLSATGEYEIVHLDLALTAAHVRHAYELLTPGGYLACYTPFFEQMAIAYDTAFSLFESVTSHEWTMREMDRSSRGTRPSTRVCHSGYITIARK